MSRKKRQAKLAHVVGVPTDATGRLGGVDKLKPAWRFYRFDYDGPWGEKALADAGMTFDQLIKSYLRRFETMTWGEIKSAAKGRGTGSKHHRIAVTALENEAQKRLVAIQLSRLQALFSLRITSKARVFGNLKTDGIFEILWYVPDHSIS